jgi:hypothetical protein
MDVLLDANEVYCLKFIAKIWGVSPETARRRFMNEPGVMRFPNDGSGKRRYCLTTVPGAVAIRVTERFTNREPR